MQFNSGYQPYLSVINNPDLPGSACGFSMNAINLVNGVSMAGLPNFIDFARNKVTDTVPPAQNTAGITELMYDGKELVQIVDLLGRKTEDKPNTVLIYVYSDGTTERVFKVE